ncbi:hypothetical protein [Actinoplanes couchii]|uniref:Nitroreductase family deazaflavin-dependent oxidoreductase n=1 Tax=Actinoplanes couchii TaxID=403638 RepID=A0ABQ3XG75_9ACTN|nr:hypothetical protein [Actinoplanes couchii]MDR6320995.1 deazaflavin-dependent oxidoreductase (nitroreductase family) [Actinoplanes couchii]GID57506.1 hypothetical protein Aco03nite_059100 [Actinoplanes couchii]
MSTPRIVLFLAGRRVFPLWGLIHHRGRKTGRDLTVPIAVTVAPDGFVINLPFGAHTNWVRNVLAAGGCVLRWKGRDHRLTDPRVIDAAAARPFYSRTAWAFARRFFPADAWLRLRTVHHDAPIVVKNHSAEVAHTPATAISTSPPASGTPQPRD